VIAFCRNHSLASNVKRYRKWLLTTGSTFKRC